jgi:hypothetical protein
LNFIDKLTKFTTNIITYEIAMTAVVANTDEDLAIPYSIKK